MNHTAAEEAMKELAALYALGALGQHEARLFEEHLAEGCESCAAELRDFDGVAQLLALGGDPDAAPPPALREQLLARVGEESQLRSQEKGSREKTREKSTDAPPQFVGASFVGAADFLVVRRDEGDWLATADAGVFAKILFVDRERDTVTSLVRMSPGARMPPHRHRGVEQCLVLEGDVRSGETALGAGDFNCAMSGSVHNELYTQGGALLLIVAPESYELLAQGV